jgi:cellulose synthase/poly-beta-1,6-N-acetylglucosamine synthase-like glycosyltransferase
LLFWFTTAVVSYTYVGYLAWLWLASRFCKRLLHIHPHSPSVTIIIAARNEEVALPRKIENLRRLRYDSGPQIIIVSDGSTDGTAQVLLGNSNYIVPVILREHQGKAAALNDAVSLATGEILVFFDVRQRIDADAILELVLPFSDLTVGAVSGSLLIEDEPESGPNAALGRYWHLEKGIRALESVSGSMVGATGAIYAIRRELYTYIPKGTILDDVFVPMHVALQGKRVLFQSRAIARDTFSAQKGTEFARKIRTLSGNFQLVRIAPWLITPRNPLLFRFISHKLLRLLSPFLLVLIFLISATSVGLFYQTIFGLQIVFYACSGLTALVPAARKLPAMALIHTFVTLNLAALVAFFRFASGRRSVWR